MILTDELTKQLSELTGACLADCRQALIEAAGDIKYAENIIYVKAQNVLYQKNDKGITQRADVITSYIHSYVHLGKIGVMIKFDVKSTTTTYLQEFKDFCEKICMQVIVNTEKNLMEQNELIPLLSTCDQIQTIGQCFANINKYLGEDIKINSIVRWEV